MFRRHTKDAALEAAAKTASREKKQQDAQREAKGKLRADNPHTADKLVESLTTLKEQMPDLNFDFSVSSSHGTVRINTNVPVIHSDSGNYGESHEQNMSITVSDNKITADVDFFFVSTGHFDNLHVETANSKTYKASKVKTVAKLVGETAAKRAALRKLAPLPK